MKKMFLIWLMIPCLYLHAQVPADSFQLQDLQVPAAPGFALLDISPATVERPTSPRMFSLQMMSYMNGATGSFPKNFAFDFSPYWMFKQQGESIYKYMGIPTAESSNMAAGLLRKLSLSFTVYSNDTAKNLLPNTSYVSLGCRTNLLTIWGKSSEIKLKQFLVSRNQIRLQILRDNPDMDLNTMRQKIDSVYASNNVKALTIKPMLVLDGAFAISEAFMNNDFKDKRFNRSGFWLNASLNIPADKYNNGNFFLIAYFRSLRDNVLSDTAKQVFNIQTATDLGIRWGFEKGRLMISAEHINRNYKNFGRLNSYRTTGIIQFKVNDGLYLMGSFGKNFSEEHNLFTMLGINWGFGKQALVL